MDIGKSSGKEFRPFILEDTSAITPDHPDFKKIPINMAILTKYGRGVYIRHGNQERCSSFFATLATIVNKLQISFGKGQEQPAILKYIKQGDLKLYLLRRLNFMYICWSKGNLNEIAIYGTIQFMHHQLMSCLTGKVNAIISENQTYDPSCNFGKSKTEHLLLHYAFNNGLTSLPILFNSIPVMPLPKELRLTIYNLLREQKVQGLQINILMTENQIIQIHKQKGIDLKPYDIFLFNTLIQSQSSLKSEIWYPICLPGVMFQDRLFCYINFLSQRVIHIMVSDEASLFPDLSKASKTLKDKLHELNLFERIHLSAKKHLISDPTLQKMSTVKHFMFRLGSQDENSLSQILMSSGNYFGKNSKEFQSYIPYYCELQRQIMTKKQGKKQKIHMQQLGNEYMGGYQQQNGLGVYFICSLLNDLEECRAVLGVLSKYVRQQENLWINKFI